MDDKPIPSIVFLLTLFWLHLGGGGGGGRRVECSLHNNGLPAIASQPPSKHQHTNRKGLVISMYD